MKFRPERRRWLAAAGALALTLPALPLRAAPPRPFRIFAITFRGMTDVEKGFQDYFTSRGVLVVDLMCDARVISPGSFSSDGFHPSDAGYALMADLAFPPLSAGSASSPAAACGPRALFPGF